MTVEQEKQRAAEASAELVQDGMTVGLGTGSTVAYLLPALARRRLSIRCVATSPRTEEGCGQTGFACRTVCRYRSLRHRDRRCRSDLADGWLVKGGAAHTREKIVAAAAARFVVIADASKLVRSVRAPIPLELIEFGLAATMRPLQPVSLRDLPPSPDGGVTADYHGAIDDVVTLAAVLSATAGVVGHGLFPPTMVSDIFIACGDSVEHRLAGGGGGS